ncbi:MAG: SIS domain-containing protein [Prolixibacteraceae bacterium]|nr:SIS domain-containing protein [Prolixibacteraceae bacterium]
MDTVLTGAGSSAFIGAAVSGVFVKFNHVSARAIPTTELITHPDFLLLKEKAVLLVSFARSGNSPESLAAIDTVNKYCRQSWHIIITCNETGELYRRSDASNMLKILLPPETNDESLAMTSSFSSMMLAYILIAKIDTLDSEKANVELLAEWGRRILDYEQSIARIAELSFSRAVFLGSGPLRGIAEESHLKLQELTDGKVICTWDSFLGFRHGPIAVVNQETLLVYLFADQEHTRRYEFDLVKQISVDNKHLAQIAISHHPVKMTDVNFDLNVNFGKIEDRDAPIEYLCVAEVLVAQLLGYYKSIALGLDPDNPSSSGTFSRVVKGVKIYEFNI